MLIDELRPTDIRVMSDAELVELSHLLREVQISFHKDWLMPWQTWLVAGLLDYVNRYGRQRRDLTLDERNYVLEWR